MNAVDDNGGKIVNENLYKTYADATSGISCQT